MMGSVSTTTEPITYTDPRTKFLAATAGMLYCMTAMADEDSGSFGAAENHGARSHLVRQFVRVFGGES